MVFSSIVYILLARAFYVVLLHVSPVAVLPHQVRQINALTLVSAVIRGRLTGDLFPFPFPFTLGFGGRSFRIRRLFLYFFIFFQEKSIFFQHFFLLLRK